MKKKLLSYKWSVQSCIVELEIKIEKQLLRWVTEYWSKGETGKTGYFIEELLS